MNDTQGPGNGALEPLSYNGGFGHPSTPIKEHHYSPTSTTPNGGTNGHSLTDLSGDTHLTLLKNASLGSFTGFCENDVGTRFGLGSDFMEMRYIQLSDWDLNGYTAEGLSARLIDSRSLNDSPDNVIQYRPWEKPELSMPGNTLGSITSTTSAPGTHMVITSNGNGVTTTTNNKSPTTLTTLTSAFPTFSDTFGPTGQKLPSFQSQFNSYNEPGPIHHIPPPPPPNAPHHPPQQNGNPPQNGNHHLPSPIPVTTSSPASAPSLPSFHTLPANRGYIHQGPPHLVATAPVQAQQQFFDDRHIQIFPGQLIATTAPVTTQHQGILTNGNGHHFVTSANPLVVNHHSLNGSNGPPPSHFITGNGSSAQQFLELVPVPPMQLHGHYPPPPPPPNHAHPHAKLQPQTTDGNIPGLTLNDLHHTHHNSNLNLNNLNVPPQTKYISSHDGQPMETLIVKLQPGHPGLPYDPHHQSPHQPYPGHQVTKVEQNSPQIVTNSSNGGSTPNGRNGSVKKTPKRKKNSVENSMEGYNNNNGNPHFNNNNNNNSHDLSGMNDPQVSSVSSTDSDYKRSGMGQNGGLSDHNHHHLNGTHHNGTPGDSSNSDKPVKKKRKRCGECVGCQRKDNCGDCAPCRNEKSHQICKVRRCEKLTEKKSRAGRVAVVK